MGSPCTNSSSLVSITTTVWRGCCSAIDCGISIALVFCSTSTLVENTSRNDTMTLRMSIIGIRLSSASARWRIWCCSICRARLDMLMRGLRSWIGGRSRGGCARGHHRGVADRDIRKQLVLHHVESGVDLKHPDAIHHLHHGVVRRVGLEQDGGIGLVGKFSLHLLQVGRQAIVVVAVVLVRKRGQGSRVAIPHLQRVLAYRDLQLQSGWRVLELRVGGR